MTLSTGPGLPATDPGLTADADAAADRLRRQLTALRAEFPCFRIWREQTWDRDRVLARSLHLGLNPYTVVTDDIAELRAALEPARRAPCPRPHADGHRS